MIKICKSGYDFEFKMWNFSAGEVGIQIADIDQIKTTPRIMIDWTYENDGEIIAIANIVDAIRVIKRNCAGDEFKLMLNMNYIPYSRQDRVCYEGESHALKVFAGIINAMKFDLIVGADPHSSVCEALFDNFVEIHQKDAALDLVMRGFIHPQNTVIVAPDAGAEKKAFAVAKHLGIDRVITATKTRGEGGKIIGTKIDMPLDLDDDTVYLMVDDIADRGGTFIHLANEMKRQLPDARVMLYTTVAIYPDGVEKVLESVDMIFCNTTLKPYNEQMSSRYIKLSAI
ncbi:MAG: hypothetical protein ACRC3J_09265 [Culicoidibacterales bacterium]